MTIFIFVVSSGNGRRRQMIGGQDKFVPTLSERGAEEDLSSHRKNHIGRGDKAKAERLIGVSHNTINKGQKELEVGAPAGPSEGIREKGDGRKK